MQWLSGEYCPCALQLTEAVNPDRLMTRLPLDRDGHKGSEPIDWFQESGATVGQCVRPHYVDDYYILIWYSIRFGPIDISMYSFGWKRTSVNQLLDRVLLNARLAGCASPYMQCVLDSTRQDQERVFT